MSLKNTDHVDQDKKISDEKGKTQSIKKRPKESGGPKGPEPTRYGDWERRGRCIDF